MDDTRTKEAPSLAPERERELLIFNETSGIGVDDLQLLDLAFTHRSYANELGDRTRNNERLEFLGDSILGLAIADLLLETYPDKEEGELSKIKSIVVSEDSLALAAKKLNIAQYIHLGKGEEQTGGRRKKALLADCTEALFGACYVHNGFPAAKAFVVQTLGERITAVIEDDYHRDYKTTLQEYMQKKWRIVPTYTLVSKTGPDHNITFSVEVNVNGEVFGPAEGRNKKAAEQAVAKIAYESLVNPQKDW